MNILVNATNLSAGGGLQVADSFCSTLDLYKQHKFVVVLSSYLKNTLEKIRTYENVDVFEYNIKNNISTIIFGRDKFLDSLVIEKEIDTVLTIFGPSRWNPRKVFHLSGFAMSQLVLKESPFFKIISKKEKLKWFLGNKVRKYLFTRSTKTFFSENETISERVEQLLNKTKCYTITNYYNQVYDKPTLWKEKLLPVFNGVTLLNISTFYPFKNLTISIDIARILKSRYKDFNFRFVFTCKETDFPKIDEELKEHFLFLGKVAIEECPSLYEQSDIVFQPTLLECFTAVYPEAMKMEKPVLTTDLDFAHSLCGDVALYYSPLSAEDAAEKLYYLATNKNEQDKLIVNGKKQLKTFDTYTARSEKIIRIIEQQYNNVNI